MYGRAITITQIFWTVGILLSQFLGFLTSAMTVGSVRVIFSVIALVALVNWSVRVFSPKFKRVEDSLVDDQKATFNSQNGQPRVKLAEILKNPAYLKILVALTMFYLFWNLPANTWGSFVNYFLVTVSHRTQAFATLVALIANVFNLASNSIYVKVADTKYRLSSNGRSYFNWAVSFFCAGVWSDVWWPLQLRTFVIPLQTLCVANQFINLDPDVLSGRSSRFHYRLFIWIRAAMHGNFFAFYTDVNGVVSTNFLWIIFACALISGAFAIGIVQMLRRRKTR